MLRDIDRVFAWLVWLAAAATVLMLLAGPRVVAEDKAKPAAAGAPRGAVDAKPIFVERCGSCHTLGAAGTSGQIGPSLDGISLDAAQIQEIVRAGRGGMPAFQSQLSAAEIEAVSNFIASSP